ncbi:hypothetical protein [Gordonia sp. (in: high G+C Gram-positive bacteria)]
MSKQDEAAAILFDRIIELGREASMRGVCDLAQAYAAIASTVPRPVRRAV